MTVHCTVLNWLLHSMREQSNSCICCWIAANSKQNSDINFNDNRKYEAWYDYIMMLLVWWYVMLLSRHLWILIQSSGKEETISCKIKLTIATTINLIVESFILLKVWFQNCPGILFCFSQQLWLADHKRYISPTTGIFLKMKQFLTRPKCSTYFYDCLHFRNIHHSVWSLYVLVSSKLK